MKDGYFEKGDIIKGVKGNRYFITNEKMKKAEVIAVRGKTMLVKVLEHTENIKGNEEHYVDNDTVKFELLDESQGDFWESLEVL